MARKEIVDYVCGIGLDLFDKKKRESSKSKRKSSTPVFSLGDYGWKLRLKNGIRKFVSASTKENLTEIGISKKGSEIIFRNKEGILKRCLNENRWDTVKGVGFETWMRVAEHVKNQEAAQIDTVVTSDIHRLIRANGTLHGKTGLLKVEFPLKDLDSFDPFVGAVAFKEGTAKVQVSEAPEFKLSGKSFGPFKNQTVELPTAAAVLLILKNRAEVSK
jgi:DNA primase small subunit